MRIWTIAVLGCSLGFAGGACAAGASSSESTSSTARTTTTATGGPPSGGHVGAHTPARDSFTGTITSGTRRYSRAKGGASVYLHVHGSRGAERRTTATIVGRKCSAAAGCLELHGMLTGTLAPGPRALPDTGQTYTFSGSGRIGPLGQVKAHGTIRGTGFIYHGREQMQLILKTAHGTVTITAQSKPVRGFTSP